PISHAHPSPLQRKHRHRETISSRTCAGRSHEFDTWPAIQMHRPCVVPLEIPALWPSHVWHPACSGLPARRLIIGCRELIHTQSSVEARMKRLVLLGTLM